MGHPIQWIKSYLTGRTSRVKVQDFFSTRRAIQVGIPQGSVLGPPLFCVMVGDFTCFDSNSSLTQYADDITIVSGFVTSNPSETQASICSGISNFSVWCERNKQYHNKEKSQFIIFSRKQIIFRQPLPIKVQSSMKILGVILNNRLTWHNHIDEIYKKASKRLYKLRVLKPLVTAE